MKKKKGTEGISRHECNLSIENSKEEGVLSAHTAGRQSARFMHNQEIQLTLVDRQILQSYCKMVYGLANYLGSAYEIVVHSLDNMEHSVIAIVNGDHTGRTVGAPITNQALKMLKLFNESDRYSESYFSRNKNGEPLKSTTIAIRGENDRVIGLLCINFYMNSSFEDILSSFIPPEKLSYDSFQNEAFEANVDDMIVSSFNAAKEKVMSDAAILPSNKNKAIVWLLADNGIFKIKESVTRVADLLGVSKNTVYLHLRSHDSSGK